MEEALITADVGCDTTNKILDRLRKRARFEAYMEVQELYEMLREEIAGLFSESEANWMILSKAFSIQARDPKVIMVVGVNGVGKTTSIGKLAWRYKTEGQKVLLGASDTFRAAAIDQLKIWSERAGVEIIAQHMGADPASVAFDTLGSCCCARCRGGDY